MTRVVSMSHLLWVLAAACALSVVAVGVSEADEPLDIDPVAQRLERFTATRWSLISPDKDYEGGCVVGFLAFQFSPTGYFTYNNRIHGSWQVDELGNLKLKTRNGIRLTLLVQGSTLRPSQTVAFLKRSHLYQRCPE